MSKQRCHLQKNCVHEFTGQKYRRTLLPTVPSPNIIIVPTVDTCHPLQGRTNSRPNYFTGNPTLNCEQSPVKCDIGEQKPPVLNLQAVTTKTRVSSTIKIPENFRNSPIIYHDTKATQASSCNMKQSIKELSTTKNKSRNNLVDLTGFDVNGIQKDLRSRLTRKRKERSLLHNLEPMENRLNRANLVITFEQDVEADSKNSSKLEPALYEPEPKKSKTIELTKNQSSGADDSDQDPPEDLSFLDYINEHADEFIDACYGNPNTQVEHNKIIMTTNNTKSEIIKKKSENYNEDSESANPKKGLTNNDNMESIQEKREETILHKAMAINFINKPNENDSKNNAEGKSKEDLSNYDSMKKIAILQEEETSYHTSQVNNNKINYKQKNDKNKPKQGLIINITLEIRSIADTNKHKDLKNMDQNSQTDRNSQQGANNIIDLTGKAYEQNASKETTDLCRNKHNYITNTNHVLSTKQDASNIVDLTGKAYEENTSEETMALCKDKLKISTNAIRIINTVTEANNLADLTENASKETIAPWANKKNIITNAIYKVNSIKKPNHITDLTDKAYEENVSDIFKDKPSIMTNSKYEINSIKEVNNITDLTEKPYEDNASKETIGPCEDKKNIITNAKYEINTKQEANNITDLTEKAYEEIASEKTIATCEDKQNIIANAIYKINSMQETNKITDLIEKAYEENASKEIIDICKDKPNIITNAKHEINTKQEANHIKTLTEKAYEENASKKKTIGPCEDKKNIITNAIHEINTKQVSKIIIEDKSDNSQNSYNNLEQNGNKISTEKVEESLTAIYDKFIKTITKSNVKNQATSLEAVKNNSQKLKTSEDIVLKTNIEIANKESGLGKKSEIVTTTKKEEEHIVSNKCLVPDGSKNEDKATMSDFISLEKRMSEYFQKKYTVSSVIHYGRFSTIYKCYNTKGKTFAVKVVEHRQRGKFMEAIFSLLQRNQPRQDSCILYLMNAFEHQGQWCLLTEYYPYDLKLALFLNKQGFHIDQVQVLARQLVDAVDMLYFAGVIHSDIKPKHVLLNGARNRLKLCGFDRSGYSSIINITPGTGTLSYRAPEVILGFKDHRRIDVWSTALVIFEMVTSKILFPGHANNEILEQQIRTFGSIDWTMVQQSKYRFRIANLSGASFKRQVGYNGHEVILLIHPLDRNDSLRTKLFQSYNQEWARSRSKFQISKDMNKLETLQTVLEKMLALDPRRRLPIYHVNNSEFMNLR